MSYREKVEKLGASEILSLFPEVVPIAKVSGSKSTTSRDIDSSVLSGYDEEQIKLMDENCIVLDYNDKPIGSGTKKLCHIMDNIETGLLHRAFSVFLFNNEGKLLLQQRAEEKITFPDLWTNTCCSHPLCMPSEMGDVENVDFQQNIKGAQIAAQRKLEHELGIKPLPAQDFKFLTRIHYKAPCGEGSKWGEHEIDYILIIKADPEVDMNTNEVKAVKYVDAAELKSMFADDKYSFTPWFKLICESYLFKWWDSLNDLDKFVSTEIDRMI